MLKLRQKWRCTMNILRLVCPVTLKECEERFDVVATLNSKTPVCGFTCAEEYAVQRKMQIVGVSSVFNASPCRPLSTDYTTGHFGKPTG